MKSLIDWKCSTPEAPWQDLPTPDFQESPADLRLHPGQIFQQIQGWGGCFNEIGWRALGFLSEGDRREVMKALFDPAHGSNFNVCRMPIGASDFSLDFYSLAEVPGDFGMEHFSIERDKQHMIPFIQAAMECQPDLKVWASPWSPPKWMKTTNSYTFGHLKADESTRKAYAHYFSKFIQAYRQEGIDLFAIMPQNEPCWNNRDYPACGYTRDEFVTFLKDDLIPRLEQDDVACQVWLGTMVDEEHGDLPLTFDYLTSLLEDSSIASKLSGIGCQYGKNTLTRAHAAYPSLPLMQTETSCGNGINDWNYAKNQFDLIKFYLDGGVSSYMLWNLILDHTGRSVGGWPQSAPVTIDTRRRVAIFNPQFHMYKHFSAFVLPGAHRIGHSGSWNDAVAFQNPDGRLVLVVQNSSADPVKVAIDLGDSKITPILPPQSWSTFTH